MKIERINPPSLRTFNNTAHVVKTDNTVYVSGQAAVDREGKVLGMGDIAAQTEEAFRQLGECLQAAGTDFSHVVKLNTYITDPSGVVPVRHIRTRYMNEAGLHPSATLAVVSRLAHPDMLVEVECIAVLP